MEWEKVSGWYDRLVGERGHYYHDKVILPKLLSRIPSGSKVLDLGCGQGVLSRALASSEYVGVDLSCSLLESAKSQQKERHSFLLADITKPIPLSLDGEFDIAVLMLVLQNVEKIEGVLENAYRLLRFGGRLFIVLNHPCFRIPRHSSWDGAFSRKMDLYLSKAKIPIETNPSKGKKSMVTFSYHRPLSFYFEALQKAGFLVESLEEWCSDKKSTGKFAKQEDRARREFPLFLMLSAIKTKG